MEESLLNNQIEHLTVAQINKRLTEPIVSPLFLQALVNDSRKSVQKLYNNYKLQQKLIDKQKHEYNKKCYFEQKFWQQKKIVAGLDEVGRGCLAGPVVCAAVIMDPKKPILGIDDSKKLSSKKRELLASKIKEQALAYSIAIISVQTIDEINILEASRFGMVQAIKKIKPQPQELLVDAIHLNSLIHQTDIIKGDSCSVSIGAASIIAKVYRDHLMVRYHYFYPEYGFNKNKGYGTKTHLEALKKYGISPIHRLSFAPVKNIKEKFT